MLELDALSLVVSVLVDDEDEPLVEPLVEPLAEPEPVVADGVLGAGALELDEDDDGADGVAVEPEPAEPLIVLELEDEPGAVDVEPFDLLMSIDVDDELEPDGAVLGAAVVPPADEDDEEPFGEAVEPAGAVVVELELEARSLVPSQAAINEAPNATDTATAIVESLMRPPWLGLLSYWEQGSGRDC